MFLLGDVEQFPQPRLVKTDDHLPVDYDDGYAHLAAFVDHFIAPRRVRGNVVLRIRNIVLLEKILGRKTKLACRGGIYLYGVLHMG